MNSITNFRGPYRWLSNHGDSVIVFNGIKYPTVEHAYQASKFLDVIHHKNIEKLKQPRLSREYARANANEIRADWDDIKLDSMAGFLRQKFSIPELQEKLLDTGNAELIEENTWNDTFWGICNGIGENNLGKLLMKIRAEIKDIRGLK